MAEKFSVRPIKTESRCKFCTASARPEIDELLLKRSKRQKTDDGQPINQEYVLARIAELGVENPTPDNIKPHWAKHCEVISEKEAEVELNAAREALERFLNGDRVNVEEALQAIVTLGAMELEAKLRATGSTGVTVDQMISAANALAKRQTNEAATELLKTTTAAIQVAAGVRRELEPAKHADVELDPVPEPEEGEFTDAV